MTSKLSDGKRSAVEREVLPVDVLFVGAGPANLGAMEPEASRSATPPPSDPRRNGSAHRGLARAPEPEAVLLERCRNGEPGGFEELFLRYKDYVYSTAFYLCRDEDGAADVTQEVFTKLLTRISQYRAGSRFTTFHGSAGVRC